jgi:ribosomal protein S12 methylthiotransferase accessory factor
LDIPVYFSICGEDAARVIGTKKQMGKGSTPEQSEASAVMELAERFSFFSFLQNPKHFRLATYEEVKDQALPFEAIARSVHDDSEDLPAAERLFSKLPLKWTTAYNLTRREETLIPFDWFFAINEFNGPSAGNCTEEAISQGVCEVVERHVSSLISRNRLDAPGIDPNAVTDPVAREMIDKYQNAGVVLFLRDFSLGMGIPTIGVLAYDPVTFPAMSELVWTAGTTPSPVKALNRALTETAQLAGDFNTASKYVPSGLPKLKNLEEASFITSSTRTVTMSQLPDLSHDNIRIEVENCITALAKKDMEVFVVDVTHEQLEIPAFYTIIPGAHFRERATGTSVGMFSAKLMTQNATPEGAITELQRADTLLPGKYYIQFFLGSCHLSAGKASEGLTHLEQALGLDPEPEDMASIYTYMALCLKEMGRYGEAIRRLEEAEKYDDTRTEVYNLLGYCHYEMKEYETAIGCFNKVLAINPGSAVDYANIASNYREMGEEDLAVEYYELALQIDPSIEFARENLNKLTKRKESTG